MKTKRIKAYKTLAHDFNGTVYGYYLPADAESYERMVEQMARAIAESWSYNWKWLLDAERNDYYNAARAALTAIGIKNNKKATQ